MYYVVAFDLSSEPLIFCCEVVSGRVAHFLSLFLDVNRIRFLSRPFTILSHYHRALYCLEWCRNVKILSKTDCFHCWTTRFCWHDNSAYAARLGFGSIRAIPAPLCPPHRFQSSPRQAINIGKLLWLSSYSLKAPEFTRQREIPTKTLSQWFERRDNLVKIYNSTNIVVKAILGQMVVFD